MTSSILVKDFLLRVSTDLLDMSPQFERWSEVELVNALNDGQRVIAKYMPHTCARVDVVKLAAGTRQHIGLIPSSMVKPGDGSSPADVRGAMLQDVVRNMGADGTVPGRVIRVVDRDVLDASMPDWHTKTGTPSQYTFDPRSPKVFYVSPGVAQGANVWVELNYLADPASVPNTGNLYAYNGVSTTRLSIDDRNVDDLFSYVMARANLKDAEFGGNAQLTSLFTNMFTSSVNAQVMALTGVNPNLKTLPMSPAAPAQAS
jgi:hypothetical protein